MQQSLPKAWLEHTPLALPLRMSGSVGLRWGLTFCISSEFPSDAGALLLGTHFKDQQPRRIFPMALYESFTGEKKVMPAQIPGVALSRTNALAQVLKYYTSPFSGKLGRLLFSLNGLNPNRQGAGDPGSKRTGLEAG